MVSIFKRLSNLVEEVRWEDATSPSWWVKFAKRQVGLSFYTLRETLRNRIRDPENYVNQIPIVTNTGIIDLRLTNHCTPRIRNACMLPCHAPSPAFFVSISTFLDTMTISSTYYRPAVADEQVRKFFDWINRLLPGYTGPDDQDRLQFIPR